MIKAEIIDSIGILTLTRPEVHNAINREMMEQMKELLHQWEENHGIKILLITGAGDRSFCSGGDIEEFHQLDEEDIKGMLHKMKDVLYQLQSFPKPTVAAINGTAVGGGCEIATACDFRLAHSDLSLGFIQIRLGITTGWGGASRLFTILPRSKAFKLLLTGDKIRAEEAFKLGFVDELLPKEGFLDHVIAWSKNITRHSYPALSAYKQTAIDADESSLTIEEKLTREVDRSSMVWGSLEHKQAVDAFLSGTKKRTHNK